MILRLDDYEMHLDIEARYALYQAALKGLTQLHVVYLGQAKPKKTRCKIPRLLLCLADRSWTVQGDRITQLIEAIENNTDFNCGMRIAAGFANQVTIE